MPSVAVADPLARYWSKRDFAITAEPRGERTKTGKTLSFVIQKHAASRLHMTSGWNSMACSSRGPYGRQMDAATASAASAAKRPLRSDRLAERRLHKWWRIFRVRPTSLSAFSR